MLSPDNSEEIHLFSNLLFLAIVLLITTLAPSGLASVPALLQGLIAYTLALGLIVVQNHRCRIRGRIHHFLFIANLELIGALIYFWFVAGAHRTLTLLPVGGGTQTAQVLLALILYLSGLFLFHWTAYPQVNWSRYTPKLTRGQYIDQQLRFLVPFAFPFMVFSLAGDALSAIPVSMISFENSPTLIWLLPMLVSVGLIVCMMVFFPVVLTHSWQCQALPEGSLKRSLEDLCKKLGFRYAAMLTWPVMGQSLTAAIIGVVPRFRYVIFTKALLEQLSPESVEAVLAHEIGHNRRRHLLIYPFIIAGAMVIIGFLSELVLPAVSSNLALRHLLNPFGPWEGLQPIAPFVTYVVVLALYYRVVFGFFSRLFERQADLAIFDAELPPDHMIKALDEVGILSGHIHDQPSWHHYSIRQRIDFLEHAKTDPSLVTKHHQKVRYYVTTYFIVLGIATAILMGTSLDKLSTSADSALNDTLRHEVAEDYVKRAGLSGNQEIMTQALQVSLRSPYALEINGVAELITANTLLEKGDADAAAQFMTRAWLDLNIGEVPVGLLQEFDTLSERILLALANEPNSAYALKLKEAIKTAYHRHESSP